RGADPARDRSLHVCRGDRAMGPGGPGPRGAYPRRAAQEPRQFAAYDCRGRNRIVGAKLSEHGKANAIDVRSVKLANGVVVGLTDPQVGNDLRLVLRKSTCARFTTVLGPGSDGYHEDHVHVDLAERAGGHRLSHWAARDTC